MNVLQMSLSRSFIVLKMTGSVSQAISQINPSKNAKQIHEYAAETLGEPRDFISGGSVWGGLHDPDISQWLCISYNEKSVGASVWFTGTSATPEKTREAQAGEITRSDVVWAYVDQNFFRHLHGGSKILCMNSHITKRFCLMS